jgi:hypothetical protein
LTRFPLRTNLLRRCMKMQDLMIHFLFSLQSLSRVLRFWR